MAPGKAKATSPPAWYEPALSAPSASEKNLAAVLLMMAEASNEKGKTALRAGSAEPEAPGSTFYPFFMSIVVAGLAAGPLGSVLLKRPRNCAAVDQSTSLAKKKKEEAATSSRAQQPGLAAPPLVQRGGEGTPTSPARSSSRGLADHPEEEVASLAKLAPEAPISGSPADVTKAKKPHVSPFAIVSSQVLITPQPPPPVMPLVRGPYASPDALEEALSALTQLRGDLQGADRRLVAGRLELISDWLHSNASVRAVLSQAVAAPEEDKRAAAQAAAAREAAQEDAEAARERCRSMEAELETMPHERAAEARNRKAEEEKMKAREDTINNRDAELEQLARAQAAEHGRLEELEKKVEAERARLEAKAKVLAEDRAAFKSLEERSCGALRAFYKKGLEKPLVTDDEGPAQLLASLVVALEGVANGIDSMVEGEARALSSSALTCVFSHLYLRDPNADLGRLLEPVEGERCTAAAAAVEGQVEALLTKFLVVEPAPPADGPADPATRADDAADGDATCGKVLTEKNNLLTQELEQCRAQLNAATAELANSKKASTGSSDRHDEKLAATLEGEQKAKKMHAAGERILTQAIIEKNKLQDAKTSLGIELKDVRGQLADSVKENKELRGGILTGRPEGEVSESSSDLLQGLSQVHEQARYGQRQRSGFNVRLRYPRSQSSRSWQKMLVPAPYKAPEKKAKKKAKGVRSGPRRKGASGMSSEDKTHSSAAENDDEEEEESSSPP
nr:caldesmon-like [Aegilops tauschii subsp. strangulata]